MATKRTKAEMEQRIRELEQQVEKKKDPDIIGFKVSSKGAVSFYGLGRFPVTLYRNQWEKLLAHQEQLQRFIQEHEAQLAVKEN